MKKKQLLMFTFMMILTSYINGQSIQGKVIDSKTKQELAYVHIGVIGENYGTISDENGRFKLNLPKETDLKSVKINFSIIGYKKKSIFIKDLTEKTITVKLAPKINTLEEVTVIASKKSILKKLKLGGYKNSAVTTGESNTGKYGIGKEQGVLIKYPNHDYIVESINFHTKFNTIDSVLFRLNIYKLSNERVPEESILKDQIFVKSYKNDKWISKTILDKEIKIDQDIIVTIEPLQFWYNPKDDNQLFYSHCKKCKDETFYIRNSSFSKWNTETSSNLALYINTLQMPTIK